MKHFGRALCPTADRDEARNALESAQAGLIEAKIMRSLAQINTARLERSARRNHYREAAERALGGDKK